MFSVHKANFWYKIESTLIIRYSHSGQLGINLRPKFRKTCSSLVKIISDGENNFTQNKYNKLQKLSAKNNWFFAQNKCKTANMGSSTV